ncbi:MAG: hypothetical protein QM639_07915 [Rhodocyclaceae bacterium]
MRKQYHFRESERGLLAWDVGKLIVLVSSIESEGVPIDSLRELDEPYWYGIGGERPTCRSIADHMRLVRASDLSYPIILSPDGRIMDGMHRVVKAALDGLTSIQAKRLAVLPDPDFVGMHPDELPYDEVQPFAPAGGFAAR